MISDRNAQLFLTHPRRRFGRIHFSVKGAPSISELSPEMVRMLGAERDKTWLQAVMSDPRLILPDEEETHLASCLHDVALRDEPALYSGSLLTVSRRPLPVFGAIDRSTGEGDYLALLYDCRGDLEERADALLAHYRKVWKDVCEWMAELDLNTQAARCLYARRFAVPDMWVRLDDVLHLRIERQVAAQDRERVRHFFRQNLRRDNTTNDYAEIGFHMTDGGDTAAFRGILIGLGSGRFLFCGMRSGQTEDTGRDAAQRKNRTSHGHIVDVTTFGAFSVSVDGVPILFRHEKARELMALLIDRRGGNAAAQSLITFLWENEAATERTYSRLRKVVMQLRDALRAHDVGDILESVAGWRRIVPEKINCDLYAYLDSGCRPAAPGTYLPEYSWSEYTHGELIEESGEGA